MTDNTPGAPIWVELITTDGDKARAFYSELFGWTFSGTGEDYGGYQIVTLQDGSTVVGGAMVKDVERMGDVHDAFSLYLRADDAQRTDQLVTEHGGTVLVPAMQVGDQGWMAFYTDSTGAGVGTWQPEAMEGMAIGAVHGMPIWFELMTQDYERALQFYRDVFAWDIHPMGDEGGYSLLGTYDESKAGICDARGVTQMPSYWRVYFHVEDTDAACELAVKLGGQVLDGPMDSPHGRLATVADDQGATFQISH